MHPLALVAKQILVTLGLSAANAGRIGKMGETSMGTENHIGIIPFFIFISDFQIAFFAQN